jgi:HAD superfamily hydrolase (TIGR01509 family)
MKLPPDMVLFDCDGVVVDSEPLTADVLIEALARHGLDVTRDDLARLFLGGTMPGLAETAREMGADLPSNWVADTYEEVFAALDAAVEEIAGISKVLDALDAAGIPFAIGSNGPHRKMQITLTRTGLLERFSGRIYSREDVPAPKPAPDVYLKAAADAGIPPERCVVIEDSPSGARAGKAAGMLCLGYVADTPRARLEPICDALFDSMDDLPGLLSLRG